MADFLTMLPTRDRNSSDWEKSSRTVTGATAATVLVVLPPLAREPQMSTDSSAAFDTETQTNEKKKPTGHRRVSLPRT